MKMGVSACLLGSRSSGSVDVEVKGSESSVHVTEASSGAPAIRKCCQTRIASSGGKPLEERPAESVYARRAVPLSFMSARRPPRAAAARTFATMPVAFSAAGNEKAFASAACTSVAAATMARTSPTGEGTPTRAARARRETRALCVWVARRVARIPRQRAGATAGRPRGSCCTAHGVVLRVLIRLGAG